MKIQMLLKYKKVNFSLYPDYCLFPKTCKEPLILEHGNGYNEDYCGRADRE